MSAPRLPAPTATPVSFTPAVDPDSAALAADVEARLRPVCAGMAPELFAELVHNICAVKLRWAAAEHPR